MREFSKQELLSWCLKNEFELVDLAEEDTSEDQRNKIYNSDPMESNIPFASIHEMLQNHQDIENENEFKWIQTG